MKHSKAKDAFNIIQRASSELTEPFAVELKDESGTAYKDYGIYAYSPNSAYRNELNALILALDGLRKGSYYQIVNHGHMDSAPEGAIIWRGF